MDGQLPQLSLEVLDRIRGTFAPAEWPDAMEVVCWYGGRETNRVRLAILTLADGDLDALLHYAQQASEDYRDVLYWAEYPRDVLDHMNEAAIRRLMRPNTDDQT